MDTTAATWPRAEDSTERRRLLHPRLAGLDPQVRGDEAGPRRTLGARLRVAASALGACLTIVFAAHAFQAPPTADSSTGSRESVITETSTSSPAAARRHVTLD